MKLNRLAATALVLLPFTTLAACGSRPLPSMTRGTPETSSSQNQEVRVLNVDYSKLTAIFMENGKIDETLLHKYWEAFDFAFPYLADNYGLHILKGVSREDVLELLVPRHGKVTDDKGHMMTVMLAGKFEVEFHFGKVLNVPGFGQGPAGFTYGWFNTASVGELIESLTLFRKILADAAALEKFLVPDAYYSLEKAVDVHLAKNKQALPLVSDPGLERFRKARDAVMFVLDTHGVRGIYDGVVSIMEHESLDWVGLEMAPTSLQPVIDTYLAAVEGTPEFESAKQALLQGIWADRIEKPHGKSEKNLYYRLFALAKKKGVPVRALDGDPMYSFFGMGESAYGAAVRNMIWADAVPTSGKGLIFGGAAHMTNKEAVNVQDFLAPRFPGALMLQNR